MYNKSRLTVRVKRFKSKMVQTLCCQHSKCEAAVQQSEITFNHICVDLWKHAQISVDGRGMYLCNNNTQNYVKFAFQFGKNLKFYSHYHLIFALCAFTIL